MPQGSNLTINSQIHQDNLEVTFTDTGLGIPLEVIEKLWTFILHDKNEGVGTWLAKC
jgi:signal transduction histidine kinase